MMLRLQLLALAAIRAERGRGTSSTKTRFRLFEGGKSVLRGRTPRQDAHHKKFYWRTVTLIESLPHDSRVAHPCAFG